MPPKKHDLTRLVAAPAAAEQLGLHRSTISLQTDAGKLQALRLRDGTPVYDVSELERYRRENRGKPGRKKG
jgi:hypothetical protein